MRCSQRWRLANRQRFWMGPTQRFPCWPVRNSLRYGVKRKSREKPFLFLLPSNTDSFQLQLWRSTSPPSFTALFPGKSLRRTDSITRCLVSFTGEALRGTHGNAFLKNVLKAPAAWYNFIHSKDKTFFSPEVLLQAPRTSYPWQERFSAVQRRGQSPARVRKSIQTSFHFRSIIIFPKAPAAQCSPKVPSSAETKLHGAASLLHAPRGQPCMLTMAQGRWDVVTFSKKQQTKWIPQVPNWLLPSSAAVLCFWCSQPTCKERLKPGGPAAAAA